MPYAPNGSPSYEICPECHTEFGFDDDVSDTELAVGIDHNATWAALRMRWIDQVGLSDKVVRQLDRIGVKLVT
jgi:hypothetical protein